MEASFRQFTRSGDKAAAMMKTLRDLSSKTGLSFKALGEGVETLLVRRFTGDEAIDTIYRLGQITGGVPEKMDRLAYALGQVRDMGRLQAEELNQLMEAGWNPLNELMKQTGKTAAELKDEMRNGRVTWDMVAKALRNATDAGGDFYRRLESLEGTATRAAEKTAAAWERAAERFGKALAPAKKAMEELKTDALNAAADSIDKDASSSMFSGIAAWLAALRGDQEKAATIFQKQWESEKAAPGAIHQYKSNQLDAQLAVTRKAMQEREEKMKLDREAQMKQADMEAVKKKKLLSDGMNQAEAQRVANLGKALFITKEENRELERRKSIQEKIQEKIQEHLGRRADAGADMVRDRSLDSMMNLKVALDRGRISPDEFDKKSRELVSDRIGQSHSALAPSLTVGSKEEYRASVGIYDQKQQQEKQWRKETAERDKLKIAALKELKQEVQKLQKSIGVEK